jgi:hypothetical protein
MPEIPHRALAAALGTSVAAHRIPGGWPIVIDVLLCRRMR